MSNRVVISQCPARNLQLVVDTLSDGSKVTKHVPINPSLPVRRKRQEKEKKKTREEHEEDSNKKEAVA